jgi:hypothetical protein
MSACWGGHCTPAGPVREMPCNALRDLDGLFRSHYDFPSGVPFLQIAQRLGSLT